MGEQTHTTFARIKIGTCFRTSDGDQVYRKIRKQTHQRWGTVNATALDRGWMYYEFAANDQVLPIVSLPDTSLTVNTGGSVPDGSQEGTLSLEEEASALASYECYVAGMLPEQAELVDDYDASAVTTRIQVEAMQRSAT